MHLPTFILLLLTTFLPSTSACLSIPSITYNGRAKVPPHSFHGSALINGVQICTLFTFQQSQFASDANVCVPLDCVPGYRMKLCRRPGDDWWVELETEYGVEGRYKTEKVWVDVEDRGGHQRTLRVEWSGCERRNWQETWFETEVLSG